MNWICCVSYTTDLAHLIWPDAPFGQADKENGAAETQAKKIGTCVWL